ncbi:MAG: hypothetical protein AAF639_06180 [Chloroflexota bacterium]
MSTHLPLGLDIFVQGAVEYLDHYEDDKTARIVINIYLADDLKPTSFIVDTGAPWCILDPILFEEVAHYAEPLEMHVMPMSIRGITYQGTLYRLPIRIPAVLGETQEVVATVFIPTLRTGDQWRFPNFIGLDGFLNRIRFAVDPASNLFYFGELM